MGPNLCGTRRNVVRTKGDGRALALGVCTPRGPHRKKTSAMLRPSLATIAAIGLVASVVSSCADVTVTQVAVAAVEVVPETVSLLPRESVQLSVTALDASGQSLPGRTVEWTALDPEVATVSESGLVRGVATGTGRIHARVEGRSSTALIEVGSPPRIALSQADIHFSATAGEGSTQPVSVEVTNGGGGILTGLGTSIEWVAGPGGWLDAALSSTSAPTTLSLRASAGGLSPGRYEAEVAVTPSGSGATPGRLAVVFQVTERHPTIGVSPGAVGFASSEGQGTPPPQTVRITNVGGGSFTGLNASISYAAAGATGWLDATLHSDSAPSDLTLRVTPQDLATGVYEAEVHITAAGVPGTAVVHVRYRYGEPPPALSVSRGTVERTVEEGASPSGPDLVRITNSGGGTLDGITLSVDYSGSARGWVDAHLSSDQAPAELTVAMDPVGLAPGTYEARARLASSAATNSPVTVLLRLRVESGVRGADPGRSTIEADPWRFTTDEYSEIEIQLRDADGDDLEVEHDVFLVTTIGALDRASGRTDDDGEFETVLRSSTVGTGTVTAYLGSDATGPSIGSVQIRVDPGEVSVEGSTIEATPTEITAWQTAAIVVQLRDAAGNAVPEEGEDIYLRTSAGRLSQRTGETDRDGRFVAILRVNPSHEGTVTITAWLDDDGDDDDDRIGSVQLRVTR